MLNEHELSRALNEWMRRYIDEPERFVSEFAYVRDFLKAESRGEEPDYGINGAAYLLRITEELAA